MGCGTSQSAVSPQPDEGSLSRRSSQTLTKDQNIHNKVDGLENSGPRKKKRNFLKDKKSSTDENANSKSGITSETNGAQKSVAFDVNFEETLKKPTLPRRLSSRLLAPLEGAPRLTYDMLLERQKLAEEKREKALEKNKKFSKKSSKRRMEIMKAREFEKEVQETEFKEKGKTAEEKRLARLEEVKEKQRLREERGRRAREKVRRMSQAPAEEALTVDVEKDDNFNKDDDVDSWLQDDGEANMEDGDGRKKQSGSRDDSGNYSNRAVSTSSIGSYDLPYQKNARNHQENTIETHDEFFDS